MYTLMMHPIRAGLRVRVIDRVRLRVRIKVRARLTRSLVHTNAAPIQLKAVHPFDGFFHGLLVHEGDKTEPTGLTWIFLLHDKLGICQPDRAHNPDKGCFKAFLIGREG